MTEPRLTFWFEFASTYSYLSGMRLPELAEKAGVRVAWRPFLLGPLFRLHGWNTSPFLLYPAKGAYMWRDMERQAARYGLAFRRPVPFPQHSVLAARVAQLALEHPGGIGFCQNVYLAQFAEGRDISDASVIASCLDRAGLSSGLVDQATEAANKAALRDSTERAKDIGLFGAPSFTVGQDIFWGDDRLEAALEHALGR